MSVCVSRHSANLSYTNTSTLAGTDCPAASTTLLVQNTTTATNAGFCLIIDMEICQSNITTARRLPGASHTVCIELLCTSLDRQIFNCFDVCKYVNIN